MAEPEYMNDEAAQQLMQMSMNKQSSGVDMEANESYENDSDFIQKVDIKKEEKKFNVGFDYADDENIQEVLIARAKTVKNNAKTANNVPDYVKVKTISEMPKQATMGKWFYNGSDRAYFEKTVAACMKGDFLVRKSGSSNGFVLCVNDSGQPVNFTINTQPDGKLEFTQQIFTSLDEVVVYAKATPLKSRINPGTRLRLESAAVRDRWFAMGMSREKCEAAVGAASHGCFIVRLSSSNDKYVLVVNDQKQVCSYSINRSEGAVSFGGSVHETIEELVAHIKVKPFQSKVTQSMVLTKSAI